MPLSAMIPGGCRPPSESALRLADFVGRRVRPTVRSARERSLSPNLWGIITQVVDVGYATMVRVRGTGSAIDGDFTPDELEVLD